MYCFSFSLQRGRNGSVIIIRYGDGFDLSIITDPEPAKRSGFERIRIRSIVLKGYGIEDFKGSVRLDTLGVKSRLNR